MNIIDFAVLFILLLYVLNGLHKGFLASLLNLGGLFLSWLGAFYAIRCSPGRSLGRISSPLSASISRAPSG